MSPLTDPVLRELYAHCGLALPGREALSGLLRSAPLKEELLARRRSLLPALRAANPGAADTLKLLEDPRTLVLVSGQQAGLLLGPAYTLHKTAAILALARELRALGDRPVLPVFWVEANDHDWVEATRITIPGLPEFRLPCPPGREGHSVGRVALERPLKRQLQDFLATHEWKSDWKERIGACLEDALTPAEFFMRLLREAFPDSGLLCLDPSAPGLRSLCGPFYGELHALHKKLPELLDRGQQRLQAHEKEAPLPADDLRAPWFVDVEGRRQRPLDEQQAAFSLRGDPDRLSPNVFSRPLLQDWLLSPALSVLGPGELLYTLQLQGAHEELSLAPPLYWPRPHLRLEVLTEARLLAEFGFQGSCAPAPGVPWAEDFLLSLPGMEEVARSGEKLKELRAQIGEVAQAENRPDIDKLAERAANALGQIEERLLGRARKEHKDTLRDLQTAGQWLDQSGSPQERRVNSLALLDHCGLRDASALVPALSLESGVTQVLSCDQGRILQQGETE